MTVEGMVLMACPRFLQQVAAVLATAYRHFLALPAREKMDGVGSIPVAAAS